MTERKITYDNMYLALGELNATISRPKLMRCDCEGGRARERCLMADDLKEKEEEEEAGDKEEAEKEVLEIYIGEKE